MTAHTQKLAATETGAAGPARTAAAENLAATAHDAATENSAATRETAANRAPAAAQNPQGPPTVEEARKFTVDAENRLLDLMIKAGRAQWVQETFITHDTEQIAADADQQVKAAVSELAAQSRRYDGMQLPADLARKLKLIKLSV